LASTRISHASGRFSVAIACLVPLMSRRPWAPGPTPAYLRHARDQVVLALCARRAWLKSRRREARGAAQTSCVTSYSGGDRFVRCLQFASGVQAEEKVCFLDRELVQRRCSAASESPASFVGPHVRGLVGAGVDQVERVAVERGARDRDASSASPAVCSRPRALSEGINPALYAGETRLTPAAR